MAGTLTIGTLSDGTNSTSSTNAIMGSAKAWVSFNPLSPISTKASFNVSSMTYNAASDYTVNFTNSFADANYAAVVSVSTPGGNRACSLGAYTGASGVTAGSCRLKYYDSGSGQVDPGSAYSPGSVGYAAFFR